MLRKIIILFLILLPSTAFCQEKLQKLSVEKIMRDPKWIGSSPSNPYWSQDGKYLLFSWNPENASADSIYYITPTNLHPLKTTSAFRNHIIRTNALQFNSDKTAYVYTDNGDVFLNDLRFGKQRRITQTNENELNPQFAFNDSKVVYTSNSNLFAWDINTGQITQLTNFQPSSASGNSTIGGSSRDSQNLGASNRSKGADNRNTQENFLKEDALENSEVLQTRKRNRNEADSMHKLSPPEKKLRTISLEERSVFGLSISPDGRIICYRLVRPATSGKNTIVPSYVTESGYTEDITGRSKVGAPQGIQEFFVFDRIMDTVLAVKTDSVQGIHDLPDYVKDYPRRFEQLSKSPLLRSVNFTGPFWSPHGKYAVQQSQLSNDKKYFFITTNEVHPGEQHFYRLPVSGGRTERITMMTGSNQVTLSPDEKFIAILYSYSNKPWELYLQETKPNGKLQQVTAGAESDEFRSYPWKDPDLI